MMGPFASSILFQVAFQTGIEIITVAIRIKQVRGAMQNKSQVAFARATILSMNSTIIDTNIRK